MADSTKYYKPSGPGLYTETDAQDPFAQAGNLLPSGAITIPMGATYNYTGAGGDTTVAPRPAATAPSAPLSSPADPYAPSSYVARNPALGGAVIAPGSTPAGGLPSSGSVLSTQAGQMNNDLYYAANPESDPGIVKLESDLKATIEAINKQFEAATTKQASMNNEAYNATNAENANSGLAGSNQGAGNLGRQAQKGKDAIDAIAAQKATTIAGIYSKVDEQILAEQKARQAAANADMTQYLDTLSKIRTDAQTSIGQLAAGGVSLDDLASKDPKKYAALLENAGWDENQAKAAWLAGRPKDSIVGTQQVGDMMMFFTQSPDGKIGSTSVSMGMNVNATDDVQTMPDGSIVVQHWSGKPGAPGSRITGVELAPGTTQGQFAAFKAGAGGVIYNTAGKISSSISNGVSVDITIPESSTLAYQNNNPGNLMFTGQQGATLGAKGFAKFATPQDGFNALVADLTAKISGQGNMPIPDGPDAGKALSGQSSIEDLARVYAPTKDPRGGNDPVQWAKQVAQMLGVEPTSAIGNLDPTTLAAAVAAKESSTQVAPAASNVQDWVKGFSKAQQNDLKSANLNPSELSNVKGIVEGSRPPLSGYGANSATGIKIAAGLAAVGYDLTKATLDWQGEQKYVATLNSATQVRLKQATTFAASSLDLIDEKNKAAEAALSRSGITNFASVQRQAAEQGLYGQDVKDAFTQLDNQITDLQGELAQVYKGGTSPTDIGLQQAGEMLNSNWDYATLRDNISLVRRNLNIRLNSLNVGAVGAGGAPTGTTAAGAPDVQGLAQQKGFNYQQAHDSGYSDDEILQFLNGQ